ncbi:MAG: HAMP domain-containing protein, partial [Chloroflexi bacterium]|nr:HAMP domain-containing protein [Chloroflexota bacterium]
LALSGALIPTLQAMGEATRRISQGDFTKPVQVPNRDELGELADRINVAARDLSRLQQALVAEERARALRERVAHVTRAQEDERRRLSRELHDGLGPSLAAVSNRLTECRQLLTSDASRADSILEEATGLLRSYVGQIRSLSHELRPPDLEQLGLVEALRLYVDRFGQETGIKATFEARGTPPADSLAEITVYQVVQECLMNVRKHSEARNVTVSLDATSPGMQLVVADDGRGFDTVASRRTDGVGLVNMRERAELVGGALTIDSRPGTGCRVKLDFDSGA